jgi:hypothetical protein
LFVRWASSARRRSEELIGIGRWNVVKPFRSRQLHIYVLTATRGGRLLAKEAARGKTRTRLRPILGTSFAVMLGVAPLAVATGELRSDIGLRRDADKRNDRLTSEKDLRSRRQGDDPDPRSADRTRRRAFSLTLLSTRTRTPSGRSLADTEDRPPGSRLEEFFDRKLVARLPRHCPRPIKRRDNPK